MLRKKSILKSKIINFCLKIGPGKALLDIKERLDELNYAATYLVDKPGKFS